jgi:hypothetical protein
MKHQDTGAPLRPIFIECLSTLNVSFVELFEATLSGISVSNPILVDLKRSTTDDRFGLNRVCALLAERRSAGGYAAFVVKSTRLGRMLVKNDIPTSFIVASYPDQSRRLILLAQGARAIAAEKQE